MSLSSSVTRLSLVTIIVCFMALLVIVVGLVFGIRDTWVEAAGINGSWIGGALTAALSAIPIFCVAICVTVSRYQDRSSATVLVRAGLVGLCVGVPVLLLLVIAAAY